MRTIVRRGTETKKAAEVKGMYRVYIAAKGAAMSRLTYNAIDEVKITAKNFDGIDDNTKLNALDLLIDTYKKVVDEVDFTTITEPAVIFVPGVVSDHIESMNYKYWVMTGKRLNGEEIEEDELDMWKEISALLKSDSADYIMIKNIKYASSSVSISKLNGTRKIDAECAIKVWDRIMPKVESEVVEEA